MMFQHLGRASLVLLLLCGACNGKKPVKIPPPEPTAVGETDGVISAVSMDSPSAPRDAQPSVPMVFQLVCYQVSVPAGTVSRNEEFWKKIDEQAIAPAQYDLLRRNGMRLGQAPLGEFE